MSLQSIQLMELAQIASSAGALYTNPSSTKTFIRGIMLHNTNTTAETVQLYWVPDSGGSVGTAAAANKFFKVILAADETLFIELPFAIVLKDTNDTIQGVTTTASKVTFAVTGDTDA